jgi:hypothetical protein
VTEKPKILRRFNIRIPLRDGATLAADLVRPADGPAPVVLVRTPYGRSGQPQSERAAHFARNGYAFLSVDVRGRGDSDGVFEPYRNDGPDGADAIDWIAAQDWCSGEVATYGGSYPARIQWLTALHRPAALRAMVCMVTPSDPFVETPTGLPGPMHAYWYRMVDGRALQYADNIEWSEVYRHRPLATMDEAAGYISPNWRAEVGHNTLDDWWEPVRYQHRIAEVDVPVLHVSGWYDDEQIGTPANYAAMVAAGRAGQRLLMGPWGHRVNTTRTLGDVDFGPDALIDLDARVLAFLDEHVRGIKPAEPAAPVRIFVMNAGPQGTGEWRDEEAWPPADAGRTVLHLSSDGRANSRFGDGRLVAEPVSAEQPPDEWTHDPDRPVPFITDESSNQIGGPDDYLGVESRGDVLVYSTEPLTEALEVIGPITLIAHVATDAADADVTAKLLDVHPGGFAQRLCDGMVRLRFRDGFDEAGTVTPGEVYEVEIALWNTCIRLPAGHRLRVEIASSAFPKFDVNLGTGGPLGTEAEGVIATNRIWHTPQRPSRLILGG